MDLTLLASLSDRGRGRLVPLRPAGACRGILPRPDLDVYVERRGAYRKLPVKLLWYEYQDTTGREGVKAYSYQAFCRMFAARGAAGHDRAFGAYARRQGVHRLVR